MDTKSMCTPELEEDVSVLLVEDNVENCLREKDIDEDMEEEEKEEEEE